MFKPFQLAFKRASDDKLSLSKEALTKLHAEMWNVVVAACEAELNNERPVRNIAIHGYVAVNEGLPPFETDEGVE